MHDDVMVSIEPQAPHVDERTKVEIEKEFKNFIIDAGDSEFTQVWAADVDRDS